MPTYTYNETLQASTDYFQGDDLAGKVVTDKYLLQNKEHELLELTPEDMHWRLAKEFARIQKKKYAKPLTKQQIFDFFDHFRYIVPQGSPMYGIGNKYSITSLSNCYVLDGPNYDSYNDILDVDKQLVNISKRRGGVGICLDVLRPAGEKTNNSAKSSTGIASWMERYSNSIREVGQNNRRGALMLTLSIHHPDILDFATIKNNDSKVTGANISVCLTDEFREALKHDTEYELRWPVDSKKPTVSKMVSAKEVWNTIIHSAWLRAEPGILNWSRILEGPADCYETFRSVATNPCSEIPLSKLDSCRLIAMNLLSYVENPFTADAAFDYEKFYNHTQVAQRLMDDLVDLESEKIDAIIDKIDIDPEPESVKLAEREMWFKIKKYNDEGRRTGLGITALGDTLAALGLKYGSDESISIVDAIYKTLKFGAYRASVDMAMELGSFDEWNPDKEKDNAYLNRFKDEIINLRSTTIHGNTIWEDMQKYGRRNVACLTTAPTGSLSILTQTSSGIEPVFMLSYTRRTKINPGQKNARVDFVDQNGDSWQEFIVYHPTVKKWMKITGETDLEKSPWFGACAQDIDPRQRVLLQAAAGKHVDHAISSTINLPEDVIEETISDIYNFAFDLGLKGITVYRDNCRSGVLVSQTNKEKSSEFIKRPQDLPCDVHHLTVNNAPYFVLIGLLGGVPYEVWAGHSRLLDTTIKTGVIHKMKRPKCYRLEVDGDSILQPITAACSDNEEALTRMISMSLRHGAEIQYVVDQLQKTQGPMTSLAKAIARALKGYVPDGSVSSQTCKKCGLKLIYSESCMRCPSGCPESMKCG